MGKLALYSVFFFVLHAAAKIGNELFIVDIDNELDQDLVDIPRKFKNDEGSNIWVLSFDDKFDIDKLRAANSAEKYVYNVAIAPTIKSYIARTDNETLQKIYVTTTSDSEYADNYKMNTEDRKLLRDIKEELRKITNKFLFSITKLAEPSVQLTSAQDKVATLKLYFQGPFCSLILQSDRTKHNYFLDPDSQSLPNWFFHEHQDIDHDEKGAFVKIPEDIQVEFYKNFEELLNSFFSFTT